ncbi:PQQ-dependent catabolism-associated CXXCW motif protein [Rubellimicrobium roseum]|uniref:PQQ-dependent catabolism-associated CXXCW motif protein n=1 Tax=Rubellimicrobium roseum TaxID=687525 RepID=A0A5C4N3I3_9RHOB|nr:PQQ-dependent catabolism-associated CXXCW motif protein [Rubellimicrobium roseum]TNC60386.1 PQQ-dependent catabolism-associated CXXCW motif protein [Rubellimicrobium roseum]
MLRAAVVLACLIAPSARGEVVPEPVGYREAPYRGATPDTLSGATVVATQEARRLWEEGRVAFVDVLPREARPEGLPEGTIWRDRPHDSIPGAVWLPNVGYARLSAPEQDYFEAGLAAVTDGDPSRPVLLFCEAECWMSWNAAKRALAMGYRDVHWYPEGMDGWTEAGLPTEPVLPLEAP